MSLQAAYDLDAAQRASAGRIVRDVHPREAALLRLCANALGHRAVVAAVFVTANDQAATV
jgi:hypothetical protein